MFDYLYGNLRLSLHRFSTRGRRVVTGSVKSRPRRARLAVEMLEDRCVPAVFNVTGLGDGLFAVTQTGKNTFDAPTLRSAIEAANATPGSNTINLTVSGTYKITIPPASPDDTSTTENNATGDFDIIPNASSPAGSTLTIVNTSDDRVAVSGNGLDRVFDINPNNATPPTDFTVVLKGFTIENGNASPGDGAAGSGGGIRDQGNVNLTLTNMVVTHNNATADGGGLVMFNMTQGSWTLTVNNSVISDDHAGDAGGGIDTDGAGTVFINNSQITGNTDINQGAGVYIDVAAGSSAPDGANMTMTNTLVNNNSALAFSITASGGGISNAGTGAMVIDHSTIENNFTGGMGGGFSDENNNGTLLVTNSLFLNNTASMSGGGIQEGGPSTTIINTEFKGNSSGGSGGALFANGTTLTVMSSTFADNTSAGNGGGIEVETTGTGSAGSTITDTTITGNQALNNAGANGGGLDAVTIGSLALLNDTINANFANNGGGVFWDGSGTFSVQNTIIAANSAGGGGTGPDANNPAGAFTDNGGNLIGVSGAGSGNTGFTAATTQTGTVSQPLDPLLGPLQNNGGPRIGSKGTTITLETEAPLRGSPAIGKGILPGAPATDERGFPSVVKGKINVGAVSQAHENGDDGDQDGDQGDQNGDQGEQNGDGGNHNDDQKVHPDAPTPTPTLDVPPLLAFFDQLFRGAEMVNANGTETIMDGLFGIPLLVSTFDSSGHLESVTWLGMNVTMLFEML
ncbi:MAG TPA: choice-of-anchor Q domain-containing protein [Gemmataceae bacterium]|nr:choice-of-anchor Q domain-containing protein [Gemmataceae bacterium]